jgi:acetate kinase
VSGGGGATILVLNAGSSSVKFELFDAGPDGGGLPVPRLAGQVDGIGTAHPRLAAADATGRVLADEAVDPARAGEVARAQELLDAWLAARTCAPPAAVGHRVVHGGPDLAAPVLVDDAVLARLEALVPLAPLHQPNNLAPIRSIRARDPSLPQVACFDTAFHRGRPEVADRFAIPEALHREGVRRYGFHGLSYEHIVSRLPEVAPGIARGRVIVAHLGAGCSACAVVDGRGVESTMGFTALDGLPMATRPGQLDPGVVLHLAARKGMDPPAIERLLYRECGLKGLSGISGDVRDLLASGDPRAGMALDHLAYRTACAFGHLAAAMGGIDGIVFTAGVGENAAPVRADIVRRCAWLGAELDPARNARHGPLITTDASRVPAYVIPTDEELTIARHTLELLRLRGRGGGW